MQILKVKNVTVNSELSYETNRTVPVSTLKAHELPSSHLLSQSRTHTEGSVASVQIAVGVPVSHC